MSYGNGCALYGRDPVFADVDAYTDRQDAAEARGERVESMVDDAIDSILASGQPNDLDAGYFDLQGRVRPAKVLLADLDPQHWGELYALLMLAPVKDLAEVVLNFRHRERARLAKDADVLRVAAAAADAEEAQAREDAALMRAGVEA